MREVEDFEPGAELYRLPPRENQSALPAHPVGAEGELPRPPASPAGPVSDVKIFKTKCQQEVHLGSNMILK